jgi:PilZ domain
MAQLFRRREALRAQSRSAALERSQLQMLESRALTDVPIDRLALLHFHGLRGVHPCVVKSLSAEGARIEAPQYYIFADEFELSFDGFKTTLMCQVVWRNRHACGVKFVARRAESGFSGWMS